MIHVDLRNWMKSFSVIWKRKNLKKCSRYFSSKNCNLWTTIRIGIRIPDPTDRSANLFAESISSCGDGLSCLIGSPKLAKLQLNWSKWLEPQFCRLDVEEYIYHCPNCTALFMFVLVCFSCFSRRFTGLRQTGRYVEGSCGSLTWRSLLVFGCLVLGFLVSWFLGVLVSWLFVSWFQSFLVSKFLGCKISKIQWSHITKFASSCFC